MLRSILSAATAVARFLGKGVVGTFEAIGHAGMAVENLLAGLIMPIVEFPFAVVRAVRNSLFPAAPVPVAPAQSAADEVMSALQEARQLGPEKILADGRELIDHVKANPIRGIDPAVIESVNRLHAATNKGFAASVITHWARSQVDGIATDPVSSDLGRLPEHLQAWARSLTPAQVAEVAAMPRQMLHHHLTSSDCHLWSTALPAASLDTAERARHAIRTAMAASRDGITDPCPQQKALEGAARKKELDAFRGYEFEPAGLRV